MANRLADATSPYLLQHADNPVDWFEWGEDAFADARERDVPIFLSVGYSSCHWCHVMAHESFEDDEVAAYLNQHFTNVKVDREERPDVDSVYMAATQALTGRGGWPMSVFLDHDGRPFHAGTYWPRRRRGGMPGFPDVLAAVTGAWREQRDRVTDSAAAIAEQLEQRMAQVAGSAGGELDEAFLARAAAEVVGTWDRDLGGFGRAPKFPQAMAIGFLLDQYVVHGDEEALAAATHSLRAMVRGGIHDQLTGGFARYSTDARWLVPHFEKMLYDNALLLGVLADAASLVPDDELLAEGAQRTAAAIDDWFEHDSGGFIAATDADSEGEEGRFFVFGHGEAVEVLRDAGLDGERWTDFLGITPAGNWEGTNVLHEPHDRAAFRAAHGLDDATFRRELFEARSALAGAREDRVPPGADDKLIAGWIGMAVRAFVTAGDRLGRPELYGIADTALRAVETHLVDDEGRLHRSWRAGRAGAGAFLEDHAAVADAALALAERTGDLERLELARRLAERAATAFAAPDGGLFTTAEDAEELWTRPRDEGDNAVPSGTALLAGTLLRLSALTGDGDLRERAEGLLGRTTTMAARWPTGFGQTLRAVRWALAEQVEVAVVGPPGPARDALVAAAVERPRPGRVTFVADTDEHGEVPADVAERVPLLAGRRVVDGRPAAYVCRNFACELPVTEVADLRDRLAAS